LFLAVVADRRPGEREEAAAPPSLAEALRGVAEVWRSPGLAGVAAVHAFAYASMLTLLGVWSGPYLHDVFGLDTVARGRILTAMGAAQILGILCYGPLDRLLNSRKRVVLGGVGGSVAILALLALLPAPPLWLAAALLIGYCFVTAYGVVIVAHGRSLFPDHLVGRGVTTVNLAQVFGATILPFATGLIVQGFDDGGGAIPAIAYRFSFAFIAVALAAGATVYSRLPDSRPRTA
ncbi:MAG TPA: MFS transporter, partial [Alphaproteobacteria bacterium]|nr:MFS transporter [Alphaproteobacteria bacterium]